MEDDAQRRISLDSFPDQFFRAAVEEELVAQDGIFVFAQIVGDAVNEGLLGYRREHAGAHLRPAGAPWTDREFQARSGYYSTLSGQQMAALFRERRSRVTETPQPDVPTAAPSPRRDVFVSHATEDKEALARPLALELRQRGLSIWFDEYELVLGDSLREKIDEGLRHARIGVVILSPSFFAKRWTQWELNGFLARLMAGERNVVLPIWHEVNAEAVREYSPALADLVAARSSEGVASISEKIEQVLRQVEARSQKADSPLESGRSTGPEPAATTAPLGLSTAREGGVSRRGHAPMDSRSRSHPPSCTGTNARGDERPRCVPQQQSPCGAG
jgi:TIR domain